MKVKYLFLSLCLALYNCEESPDKNDIDDLDADKIETKKNNNPLEGAWELTGFYNYDNGVVVDSFDRQTGYRQVKMYTPTKVMWSKKTPTDTTEWFGYGSYRIENGQLVEVLDYGSRMMSLMINEREEFRFDLTYTDSTFSQIEIDDDGNRVYSENYKRID